MSLVEEIKNIKSNPREVRNFGLTVGGVFCILGVLLMYMHRPLYPTFLGVGVAIGLLGLIIPTLLRPLQKVWMAVGIMLGWIVMRIILLLFFYAVLTPFAYFARVSGTRFLSLRFERMAKTYWTAKTPNKNQKERLEKQF